MKKILLTLSTALLATVVIAQMTDWVPAGSMINVRTDEFINARSADGRIYSGTVNEDVIDSRGYMAIPRGARVELIARRLNGRDMVLDLESVEVNGQRYSVRAGADEVRAEGGARK